MNINIETKNGKLTAYSPYNPDLPGPAKKLGGKWSPADKAWTFDPRDEARVRELYRSIYGTDGTVATGDLVTVKATVKEDWLEHTGGLFLYGRQVARATGRDSGARLADGVIVVQGKGFGSCGSMKNWKTIGSAGTVFELRDVPRAAVQNNGCPSEVEAVVVERGIDRAALKAEKDALMARIAEIDSLLV